MKVILLKDVEKLGKRLEVKNVESGYARNYLIPNDLARPATKETLKWLEIQREIAKEKQGEELKKLQSLIAKIEGQEIYFSVKVGEKGQLFESITAQKIKDALEDGGFELSKDQIQLKEPIKELGEFTIKINFDHSLESFVKVIITKD
ncbi:MAG: 50S ribosomal protein L9 [Minisyncoccales bacterium]|jgi:large subunit ribosomal protein L9